MEPLKVTYYMEEEQTIIKPFIHEETSSGQEYFRMKQDLSRIKNCSLSEELNKVWEEFIYASYYASLLGKGHSYEELLTLLKQ